MHELDARGDVAAVEASKYKSAEDYEGDQKEGAAEPEEELLPAEEREELVEIVGGFGERAEGSYEDRAGRDEEGAGEGVAGEGFAEDEGCADGIEDETGLCKVSIKLPLGAA